MSTLKERARAIGEALVAALTKLGASKKPVDVNENRPVDVKPKE